MGEPGTSCSCERLQPSGTDNGESIETISGLAAKVSRTRSESVTMLFVLAFELWRIDQPVALRSLPVKSMPTIVGQGILLRSNRDETKDCEGPEVACFRSLGALGRSPTP